MLMQTEVSTAVRYGIPAAWIVLNDCGYGMIEQGMRALGLRPLETALPETDFAAWARALGADGVRVERETELDAALAPIRSAAPAARRRRAHRRARSPRRSCAASRVCISQTAKPRQEVAS